MSLYQLISEMQNVIIFSKYFTCFEVLKQL